MDKQHDHTHHNMVASERNAGEYAKFAVVLLAIAAVSYLLYSLLDYGGMHELMRLFMAVFLLTFGSFKLVGYRMFIAMFAGYDLIAKRSRLYAQLYPFLEILFSIAYLLDFGGVLRDVAVLIVFSVGSIGVFQEVFMRKSGVHCACLGNIIKLPLSSVSLIEDTAMIAMVLYML